MIHPEESLQIHRAGFTLVELSIVLVIIALILGGVLVARELVAMSQVRAAANEIDRYKSVASTFRLKYGNVPGDLPSVAASQFGFISRSGGPGVGDGNGKIETNPLYDDVSGEALLFWSDLSSARLIPDAIAVTGDANYACQPCLAFDRWLPRSRFGSGNYWYAIENQGPQPPTIAWRGLPYYTGTILSLNHAVGMHSTGDMRVTAAITPAQAYALDSKIDDGLPMSGSVGSALPATEGAYAGTGLATNNSEYHGFHARYGDSSGYCVSDIATPHVYNTRFGDPVACSLMIAMKF